MVRNKGVKKKCYPTPFRGGSNNKGRNKSKTLAEFSSASVFLFSDRSDIIKLTFVEFYVIIYMQKYERGTKK